MNNLCKLVIVILLSIVAFPANASEVEKCEIHMWLTEMAFIREWGMHYGPVSDLTNTVEARIEATLTLEAQLNLIKESGLTNYFPSERNDMRYEGRLSREELQASLRTKSRLQGSKAKCYVDFIILYNKYEDMMLGRRRLYTALTLRDFSNGKPKAHTKEMIDPLSQIDELYNTHDIAGMDKEIVASFTNNVREFFLEAPKKYQGQ